MVKNYMSIINLNENETNIKSLTRNRPLASIPVGGRYRIIDFVLSNMVNVGIRNIGIFTQSRARSLLDHLGTGKAWDLDRKMNGLFIFNFGVVDQFLNDIEIIKNNMDYLYQSSQENVILSSSYMVCNIDYKEAIRFYEESGSDITVIYKRVSNGNKNFIGCDALNIDSNNKIISVGKNVGFDAKNNISMEMFIMKKETLINLIHKCVKNGYHRTLKDAIYQSCTELNIMGYEFKGYLECVNSITSYYKLNMDMLDLKVTKELFYNHGLIYTKVKDEAPTKYGENAVVSNCLIANGCMIEGTVENSIISRRVKVHKGAKLENCIIMQNCEIKEGARLSNVVIDKNVIIQKNKELKGDKEFPLVIEKKALI